MARRNRTGTHPYFPNRFEVYGAGETLPTTNVELDVMPQYVDLFVTHDDGMTLKCRLAIGDDGGNGRELTLVYPKGFHADLLLPLHSINFAASTNIGTIICKWSEDDDVQGIWN